MATRAPATLRTSLSHHRTLTPITILLLTKRYTRAVLPLLPSRRTPRNLSTDAGGAAARAGRLQDRNREVRKIKAEGAVGVRGDGSGVVLDGIRGVGVIGRIGIISGEHREVCCGAGGHAVEVDADGDVAAAVVDGSFEDGGAGVGVLAGDPIDGSNGSVIGGKSVGHAGTREEGDSVPASGQHIL